MRLLSEVTNDPNSASEDRSNLEQRSSTPKQFRVLVRHVTAGEFVRVDKSINVLS